MDEEEDIELEADVEYVPLTEVLAGDDIFTMDEGANIYFYNSSDELIDSFTYHSGLGYWISSTTHKYLYSMGLDISDNPIFRDLSNPSDPTIISDHSFTYFEIDEGTITVPYGSVTPRVAPVVPTTISYTSDFMIGHELANTIVSPRNIINGFIEGIGNYVSYSDHCKNAIYEIRINKETAEMAAPINSTAGGHIRMYKAANGHIRAIIDYNNSVTTGSFTLVDEIVDGDTIITSMDIVNPGFNEGTYCSCAIVTSNHTYIINEGVITQYDNQGQTTVYGMVSDYNVVNQLESTMATAINTLTEDLEDIEEQFEEFVQTLSDEIKTEFNSIRQTFVSR